MEDIEEQLEKIRKDDKLASKQTEMSIIVLTAYSETWDAREIRSAVD